jgi:hypothetical protein
VANGLAGVLAQYSLGFGSEIEVLHDLPQCMLGELPHLKEMRLAEIAELLSKLRIYFDAQRGGRHVASILFVTENGKRGAFSSPTPAFRSKTKKYTPGVRRVS